MKRLLLLMVAAGPVLLQAQITGGPCTPAMLKGSYAFAMTGRSISINNVVSGYLVSNGTATFDGVSSVTISLTADTTQTQQKALVYSGNYNLPSNCNGAMAITSGTIGSFNLTVWNSGGNFTVIGEDATYAYIGNGALRPGTCILATISGSYNYAATGFTLSAAGGVNGTADEAGLLQFDGQGKVTYSYSLAQAGTLTPKSATGTYTLASSCIGTAALTDATGKTIAMNLSVNNVAATSVDLIEASSGFVRTGTAHSTFLNPSQSIGNVASYAVSATPPGSVFVIFGANLAGSPAGAVTSTLPTTLGSTSVLVNGVAAPLFYVDQNQIDAQMPWDAVTTGPATVVVMNGAVVSNAATVVVPAVGTPGLSVYGNNRAVVVNKDGQVNSASAGTSVGDEVVAYFTGGGPVTSATKLVSGMPAPSALLPISGTNKVTVNGVAAKVAYIGLTPGSIGLYQVNFFVPTVAKGTWALQVTIGTQASNSPVMTVN
jgi:uncharacterized protein (TIGR03437 family)